MGPSGHHAPLTSPSTRNHRGYVRAGRSVDGSRAPPGPPRLRTRPCLVMNSVSSRRYYGTERTAGYGMCKVTERYNPVYVPHRENLGKTAIGWPRRSPGRDRFQHMAGNLQKAKDTSQTAQFTRLTIGYRDETVDLHGRPLDVVRSSGGEGPSGQVGEGHARPLYQPPREFRRRDNRWMDK